MQKNGDGIDRQLAKRRKKSQDHESNESDVDSEESKDSEYRFSTTSTSTRGSSSGSRHLKLRRKCTFKEEWRKTFPWCRKCTIKGGNSSKRTSYFRPRCSWSRRIYGHWLWLIVLSCNVFAFNCISPLSCIVQIYVRFSHAIRQLSQGCWWIKSDVWIYTIHNTDLYLQERWSVHHSCLPYIDDILLAAKSQKKIAQVKRDLAKRFQLKDMGELHYFLGVSVKQASETGRTWIGQPGYTEAVLKKFGMENCKPANAPIASGTKLLKATDDSERVDTKLYQSAVGCLLYLPGWTRPDIAYAVSSVARFCSDPTKEHWTRLFISNIFYSTHNERLLASLPGLHA